MRRASTQVIFLRDAVFLRFDPLQSVYCDCPFLALSMTHKIGARNRNKNPGAGDFSSASGFFSGVILLFFKKYTVEAGDDRLFLDVL